MFRPRPHSRMLAVLTRSLALLLAMAAPALAQAPRITPAGDPTVRNDTIYRLAVNPADHPDDDYIYLLDDGVVRLEADGRGSRTYRQVVQILTREAAETWGEQSFSYVSGRERLTLNWVRVVKPTGEVISARPTHEQESIAPVAQEAPVFSDVKLRRVSSGGIVPGTLLDYSYTVETLKPVMPGDFQRAWRVTTGRLTRRSRYVLDVPANLAVRVKEVNLTFPRTVVEGRGRRVYTWATADVPKIEREPFAADSNGIDQYIDIAAPVQWSDVARWYGGLSRDRYVMTPGLDSALGAVVTGARTLDDSLRALHRWVAQDFRYVSLSLGIGGFQPRLPAAVLATRYGDCKDKATLFIALARRLGLRAYPVLLSSSGGIARDRPSALAFDHMIAAVERPGGYLYLDLTSELTPFGSLPPAEQGEFGLMVHPVGSGEEVTFPADSAATNRDVAVLTGDLSPRGVFHGRYVHVAAGDQQYGMRQTFATPFGTTERERITRAAVNMLFPGAPDRGGDPRGSGDFSVRQQRHSDAADSQLRRREGGCGRARGPRPPALPHRCRRRGGAPRRSGRAQADPAGRLAGTTAAQRHGAQRVRDLQRGVRPGRPRAARRTKAHRPEGDRAARPNRRPDSVAEGDGQGRRAIHRARASTLNHFMMIIFFVKRCPSTTSW